MTAREVVAKDKGLDGARVLYKRNAAGEHVVAVIWTDRQQNA